MFGFFSIGIIEAAQLSRPIGRVVRNTRNKRRWHQRIYWRDNGICQYCHSQIPYKNSTLDHIIPLIRGGKDCCKENFVLACMKCNQRKGALIMDPAEREDLSVDRLRAKWLSLDKVT